MNNTKITVSVENNYSDAGARCGSPPESYSVYVWRGDCLARVVATCDVFADALAIANTVAARECGPLGNL